MSKLSQNLKELIYQYNGVIIIESDKISTIFNEIESIRNSSNLKGYIFRPKFASSVEFKEYTQEDYMAIYAQWSLSFGWDGIFEFITNEKPQNLLDNYLKDSVHTNIEPLITEDFNPTVEKIDYIKNFVFLLAESKSTLTFHQKEILNNLPQYLLKELYENANFIIKENKNIIISNLMDYDTNFNPFEEIEDIIPLIVKKYNINNEIDINKETLNKTLLKKIKVKIPTSVKRKILDTLTKEYYKKRSFENFKKYQNFWKALLRQIQISNNFDKTVKQYPLFKDIYSIVYSNIKTNRTEIEDLRKKGKLKEAFLLEMNNSGFLLRNLLFYLRNKVGREYPTKEGKLSNNKIKVKTDINDIISSEEFEKLLLSSNPKILLQLLNLLKDKKYNKKLYSKIVHKGYKVIYDKPISPLVKKWKKIVIKKVKKAYSILKKQKNNHLGKVFIDKSLKNLKVNFSGKLDINTNTSGTFLPIGSKIKIEKFNKEDMILRYGVSWKSPEKNKNLSICIDPSVHIINGNFRNKVINWMNENHTLKNNKNEIIISSSGDITQCTFNKWSTELIDIDINEMRKNQSTKFFTSVINYDGFDFEKNQGEKGNLGEVNTHIFLNIINKNDRIISGRDIEIPLDKMDYSFKIDDNVQSQLGLMIDLEEGTIEVLKIPVNGVPLNSNAVDFHNNFLEIIENKPKLPKISKSLKNSIDKKQIVKNKKDADIILDLNTDNTIIQNILF